MRESSQGTGRDDDELGGGADGGERRRRSTAAGGDEGDGDVPGRPAPCGLTGETRKLWRSFCACRRGEGEAVATATACGSDGSVRARWGMVRERTGGE